MVLDDRDNTGKSFKAELFLSDLWYEFCCDQWPLLLTWINFNPSMDKWSHAL